MKKGFSVIEILMVLVIFSVAVAGVAAVLQFQSKGSGNLDATEKFFESMVLPIDQLKRDASIATSVSNFNSMEAGFQKGLQFTYSVVDSAGIVQIRSIEYSHFEISPCFIQGISFPCAQLRRRDVQTNTTVIFRDLIDVSWCVEVSGIGTCPPANPALTPPVIPTTLPAKRLSGLILLLPQTFALAQNFTTPIQVRTEILNRAIRIPFIIELENINLSGMARKITVTR